MTYIKALTIKADFTTAMKFADYGGKSRVEALSEPAKKYSEKVLAEAYKMLARELDREKEVLEALFVFAIKSKRDRREEE
jgi:hypothetical protein